MIQASAPRRLVTTFLIALLLSIGLGGCASERYKAQVKKEKEEKDKYVDYYPVGSRIPVRIPKDQAKPTEAETARTQEVFRGVQQGGVRTPGDPESMAAPKTR